MRHKHKPKVIKIGPDYTIEECEVCGRRRVVTCGTGWVTVTRYSRWVTKENADKYVLDWLWYE